jgi:hypothetical protein
MPVRTPCLSRGIFDKRRLYTLAIDLCVLRAYFPGMRDESLLLSDAGEVLPPRDPLVERLRGLINSDRVFNHALPKVRSIDALGGQRLDPAGVDAVACLLARVLSSGSCDRLAFALPRGGGPLAALVGLYLALSRKAMALSARWDGHPGTGTGSVSIATMRPELRQLVRRLTFDGADMNELIEPARLVSRKEISSTGRVRRRVAAVPLRGGARVGLSQRDSFLLFHRLLTMPPVPEGVIQMMVIDTAGTTVTAWEQTFERNRAARRTQLWIGELGQSDFERFCTERSIPLVRFDWHLLAASANLREGKGPLASTGLDARARAREPISWRLVSDEEREEEFAKVYASLRAMRDGGRTDMPDVLRIPYRLTGLLSRLACSLEVYERVAGPNPYAVNARALMAQCEQVTQAAFIGSNWKHVFDDYWPVVMAALRNLIRCAEDSRRYAKDEALVDRAITAMDAGRQVRVLCQTRAEGLATRETLDGFGLGLQQGVRVASYADRIPWGGEYSLLTLLLAPPPPWHGAMLLSGERGSVEVLCYAHEVGRLHSAVRAVTLDFVGAQHNAAVADGLQLPSSSALLAAPGHGMDVLLVKADSYGPRTGPPPDDETDLTRPGGDVSCWEELVGLYGQDLPLGRVGVETDGDVDAAYPGQARLVHFTDAQPVFFRDDGPITVYVAGAPASGPSIISLLPGELTAGMTVLFLPGAQRNDLVGTLTEAWDEQLQMEQRMFEPLFREALDGAVKKVGIEQLARACGHRSETVQKWVSGQNWPQKPEKFQVILDLAEMPHVSRAAAPIWRYFERVRGAHRYIGRLLNEAVEETVVAETNRDTLDKLSRLVGRDLEDIFDQLVTVTVKSVEAPRPVPLAACGQFLDPDDPYIHKEGFA